MRVIAVIFFFLIVSVSHSFADIVITNDEMVLNGKIVEDRKPAYIIFANNYGRFTISYKQIKEIRRTKSFKEDIRIFRKMGKSVSDDEIISNYMAGEKRLEELSKESEDAANPSIVLFNISGYAHTGELASVLPFSSKAAVLVEIPFGRSDIPRTGSIYGVMLESGCLYSSDNGREIIGINMAAGPDLNIRIPLSGKDIVFDFSLMAGWGWYRVKNNEIEKELESWKWNVSFKTGPLFSLDTLRISPGIGLIYVHDGEVPLFGAGIYISAGFSF